MLEKKGGSCEWYTVLKRFKNLNSNYPLLETGVPRLSRSTLWYLSTGRITHRLWVLFELSIKEWITYNQYTFDGSVVFHNICLKSWVFSERPFLLLTKNFFSSLKIWIPHWIHFRILSFGCYSTNQTIVTIHTPSYFDNREISVFHSVITFSPLGFFTWKILTSSFHLGSRDPKEVENKNFERF